MGLSRLNLALTCSIFFASEIFAIIPHHHRDSFELDKRDDNSWLPPGAPPLKKGEGIFDWIDRVVDDGAAAKAKAKRDTASDFVSPNDEIIYEKNTTHATIRYKGTLNYTDGPVNVQFERSIVDSHQCHGVKPDTTIGPFVKADGSKIENATFADAISEVYDIGRKYSDAHARNQAMSALVNANIEDIKQYSNIPDNCTQLPATAPYEEVIHDELRKLLADGHRPVSDNVGQYYGLLFTRAVIGGPIIAAVQVGFSQLGAPSNAHGWEQWLNNAIGWGIFIFIGVEASRFGPELTGGPAIIGLALTGWFKTAATKAKNIMGRVGSSGAALSSLAQGGQTGPNVPCVDADQANQAAVNWGNMGALGNTGIEMANRAGIPIDGNDFSNILPPSVCRSDQPNP